MKSQAIGLMFLATLLGGQVKADEPAAPIGKKVANFTLKDFRGQSVSLDEAGKQKIVVLAVLGTQCPLCTLYGPRLAELATAYESKGVVFLGLDANRQDAVTEIASYARVHGINFPILKDLNQVVADQIGAQRTPEVVVLDREHVIRYRGRIDNQYGIQDKKSFQKSEPSERDLAITLDALVEGKPVSKPETQAVGCLIGRDFKPVANSEVTYCKQIARILNTNCVACHRDGEIAPFALTNYDEVAGWAGMIDEVVREQRMPPWHADKQFGHFSNDARLSDDDKSAIATWVANGAPQGDPKDLPEPPKFTQGWTISKPDQVVYMQDQPFKVQATGVLEYQFFTVDPGWKEDKWISAVEARPGNSKVVHHILMFVLTPDGQLAGGLGSSSDFLAAYAPGNRPEPLPSGMARFVPAGSKLIFQLHYTPNGSAQEDRSYCGFVFTDAKTVKREVRVNSAINFVFRIPPGNGDYAVYSRYIFREDKLLLTLMPHMHLRGKAFRYVATYPDGKQETLLDVPHYDFGWQTNYRLAEAKLMPAGTRLECLAHFDNSSNNPSNPNPRAAVRFGDQTFEEMMIGFFETAPANQDLQNPDKLARPQSRLEEFNVIMAATKGDMDDNIRLGAKLAPLDPEIFREYGSILRSMVPQVDRMCVTGVKDGQLREIMSPARQQQSPAVQAKSKDGAKSKDEAEAAAKPQADAKQEVAQEEPRLPGHSIRSALAPVPVEGESLAEYANGTDVVVNNDLTKAKGKLVETMIGRGARSSMHVPVKVQGQQATVNFWSTDPDAFPPQAQALLTQIAKMIFPPRTPTQSAAK